MFGFYVFSLILGGAFLLLSLFGDALGSDVDGLEADVDVDVDADGAVDASSLWKILSIRSLIYALFGFGAVGTALTLTGAMSFLSTLIFAGATGLVSGAFISWLFAIVRRSEAGERAADSAFEGLLGDVTVPFGTGGTGQIAVARGGRRHVLLARPHSSVTDPSPEEWTRVVVIELDGGVAHVAPAGPDLLYSVDETD